MRDPQQKVARTMVAGNSGNFNVAATSRMTRDSAWRAGGCRLFDAG
jgi:hypothetical protein